MVTYSDVVQDDYQRPISGVQVYVYNQDGSLASLLAMSNPVTTNIYGQYTISVPDPGAVVNLEYRFAGVTKRLDSVIIGKPAQYVGDTGPTGPANSTYRSLTELKAAPQANGSYTLLTATGRAEYAFVAGNFTGRADDQAVVKLDSVPLTTGALVRATDPLAYKYGDTMRGNRGGRGSFYGQTTILLIGDSIGQAYAIDGTPSLPSAANYRLGYSWIVGRSVMNAAHQGYPETQGPGYHTILNAADAFKAYGYDGNGSFAATGVWGSRTRFSSGQYIAQTGVEANYGDVFYDATASSGSLVYKLNGVTVATIPITGSGIKSTIFTQIKPTGHLTALTDTFRVEAQGGAVEIVSPIVAKHSPGPAPFVFVGATSGYSYTDYNTSAAMDEMATYLNFVSSDRRVLVCCIGTNSLYNNDKKVSPAGMVAQMEQLYAGMKTRVANFSMLVSVPPLSDTTKFPLLVPGFTREDYALAILSWAASRDVSVMRHDLADISLADGLHPDIAGHRTYADVVLEALGVPFDPFMKDSPALDTDYLRYIRTDTKIAYNNTWVDFNADFTVYASRLSGRVQLSGAIKGGSAASIGTLPAGFRPNIRDRKLPVVFNPDTTPSVGMVNITPAGILSVIGASVPGSIDLSGVSFDVDPAL